MKSAISAICLVMLSALSLGAEEYDLDQFLSRVEQHSNDLKLAEQETRIAGAQKREAMSGALPHLSASAGYNRNLSDRYMYIDMGEGLSKLPITRNNEYNANVVLSQTLFNGSVYNAVKAAKQYQKLSDFVYEASYQDVMAYAKKAFHQALLMRVVWGVSRSSEQNAHENYLDIRDAYDNGLVSEFDLLQAEVRYQDYVPRTTEAERNYNLALINLKNLAGIPVEQNLTLDGSLDDYPALPEMLSMEQILQGRPDYNALLWEEKLRNTGVCAEKSAYMPTLTGNFTYAYSAQSDRWSLDEKNDAFMVGLNLSIPIFSGGATRARVQKARIELDMTRINIDRTIENIEMQTESIRLRLVEASKRIVTAEATLKTAEKAFEIAEATSKAGLTTQLELKDSRVVLDQATTGKYSAVYEYLDAYFDWELSIGRVTTRSGF